MMPDTGDEDERLCYIYTSKEKNTPSGNEKHVVNVRAKNIKEAKDLYKFAKKEM